MQAGLSSLGFETTLLANTSAMELLIAIDDLRRNLTALDTRVVYFHGYLMRIDNENYLLPIDFKAANPAEAKQRAYSLSALVSVLDRSRAGVVIVDPGGDQPFEVGLEWPAGVAAMKPAKKIFLAFGVSPSKTFVMAESQDQDSGRAGGLFGRLLLEGLMQQRSIGLGALLASVRSKVKDASGGRQIPWLASGSRTMADLVLNEPGRQPIGDAGGVNREKPGMKSMLNSSVWRCSGKDVLSAPPIGRRPFRSSTSSSKYSETRPGRRLKKMSLRRPLSIWPARPKRGRKPPRSRTSIRRSEAD